MRSERLLLILVGALLALVCLKFPVWGVIAVERKLDAYLLVSRDTIAFIDEMSSTLSAFGEACEAHQAAERDLYYLNNDLESLAADSADVEEATTAMYAAVAHRKALAANADFGLLKTMILGTQAYTHSTWLCAPAYASFTTQINLGFTPTYDPPAT